MSSLYTQPIIANARFREGALGRVFINDLPFFQGYEKDGFSVNSGINHLLVPGDNEVAIELLRAPSPRGGRLEFTPDPDPKMAGIDVNQSVEVTVFRERAPNTGDIEILCQMMFPDIWKDIDEKVRRLPYRHVMTFNPQVSVPELAFLSATPEVIPCEGTRELQTAVRELHQTFVDKDKQRAAAVMKLQMSEYARANGNDHGSSLSEQLSALDTLFAEPLVVAPLQPEQLHFIGRAGGKVVHVERTNGEPVIDVKTIGKPQGHASDPVFTRLDGRWQLM
ncbi:MAG TPA: hypothetical protein ENK23_01570 [Sorangium sp.]|nr:hypothetical protein [Sorangium sp.]